MPRVPEALHVVGVEIPLHDVEYAAGVTRVMARNAGYTVLDAEVAPPSIASLTLISWAPTATRARQRASTCACSASLNAAA